MNWVCCSSLGVTAQQGDSCAGGSSIDWCVHTYKCIWAKFIIRLSLLNKYFTPKKSEKVWFLCSKGVKLFEANYNPEYV